MFRLAYIVTHPIQYQAPLLRLLAANGDIDLKVFFLSDFSLHAHHEAAFGKTFKWDVNLTDGYEWEVLPRWGIGRSTTLGLWWPVKGLKRLLAEGNFDAVWVHGWSHPGLRQAARAARALGLPLLLRGETTLDSSRASGWKQWLRNRHLKRLFHQTDAFLCIGTRNREFYQEFKVPADKLFLMPYAVDNELFQVRSQAAAAKRKALRKELELEPERPIILFAAKFIPAKAPGDLLAAYQREWGGEQGADDGRRKAEDRNQKSEIRRQKAEDKPKPYLLLVGDGPLRGELEAQAGAMKGADVRFLGFKNQSELPAYYDLCDVFVLPSHHEPWGLVINEVMNAGKPVIVADCAGSAPDLVQPGFNGWVFPHGNLAALADCLRQAFGNADLLLMGQRSLEIVSRWDYQADLTGLLAALKSVSRDQRTNR
jgi:glycosyltransferase involved in cell wall biosynthesis